MVGEGRGRSSVRQRRGITAEGFPLGWITVASSRLAVCKVLDCDRANCLCQSLVAKLSISHSAGVIGPEYRERGRLLHGLHRLEEEKTKRRASLFLFNHRIGKGKDRPLAGEIP